MNPSNELVMNVVPCSSTLSAGWSWGWGDGAPRGSKASRSRKSVCGVEGYSPSKGGQSQSSRSSITRLHPHQYLNVAGPGVRPHARRSSAPLLRDSHHSGGGSSSCSSGSGEVRVPFADSMSPLSYDPYGPYSVYGLHSSSSLGGSPRISPRVSPRTSPRISPRSSPRRQSRVMSRELYPEELVVVSVPCRERKVSCTLLLCFIC